MKEKFQPAFKGLLLCFQDKAIRIQLFLALCTVIAGVILKLTYLEWVVVILAIGLVLVTEVLNTCIEKCCDLYSLEENQQIKYIKDLSAGAVLISSIVALLVALVILMKHLGG